ncbi:MAG: hypothetical protein A2146_02530 [Actinobacteria bacterium RBG_16_67_10]|nr:MAG: hypothetical protein A2146_02530 [Actinobacteria bacterium RBG_16_67_10]
MAGDSVQTYANHRRLLVPWHVVALPILGANTVVQIIRFIQAPGLESAWNAVVAAALVTALICARWMTLRMQDRIIRLEETLRLELLLPGRNHDIERLSRDHLVGIRFASDAEVPHLVDRILAGELVSRDDVKRAVQHWRADHLRA